ncbi:MAG: methyltransferase domain-containing protein [Planctomycetales bacterium]
MRRFLSEQVAFLKQFRSRFETTGSVLPSSRFLAKAITRYVARRGDSPIRVLECGPGTGAFTNQIVRWLQPGDTFHLVELNQEFVKILQKRFECDPQWKDVADLTQIHELPLQEFEHEGGYDFIISGLPHNNFSPEDVQQITASYFRLLKSVGTLSYFEYMFVRPVRKVTSFGTKGRRFRQIDQILQTHCHEHRIRRDSILINFPPAWVQHLSFNATGPEQAGPK